VKNPQNNQLSVEVLSSIPLFEELKPSLKQSLDQTAILRSYASGQIFCFEGDPCQGIYIIKEGWLKSVRMAANGREQILRFFGPGEIFNIVELITPPTEEEIKSLLAEIGYPTES